MTWALMIAAGAMGVGIGLRFRVPVLLVATILVATVGLGLGLLGGNILLATLNTMLTLATLQIGYLVGLGRDLQSSPLIPQGRRRDRQRRLLASRGRKAGFRLGENVAEFPDDRDVSSLPDEEQRIAVRLPPHDRDRGLHTETPSTQVDNGRLRAPTTQRLSPPQDARSRGCFPEPA